MGSIVSKSYMGSLPPEIPEYNMKPTFPPELGFKSPRVPRESKLSEQEMKALQIKKHQRDYCAHIWKDYLICARDYRPFAGLCNPEFHAYEHCQIEDQILRMKEYERERRLRMRAAKKQKEAGH